MLLLNKKFLSSSSVIFTFDIEVYVTLKGAVLTFLDSTAYRYRVAPWSYIVLSFISGKFFFTKHFVRYLVISLTFFNISSKVQEKTSNVKHRCL